MRDYITFSLCWESGEADLTPKSREYLDNLVKEGDLWGVDVIGDMHGIMDYFFDKMLDSWSNTIKSIYANAREKGEADAPQADS